MRLDGFVSVTPPAVIQWASNGTLDPAFYSRFRVCGRFTGHVAVTLNGVTLETSPAGSFDWTLVCHDVAYLPAGLLPLSVLFASGPTDANNGFQMWIIPLGAVVKVANPVGTPFHTPSCQVWLYLHGFAGETLD